MTFCAAPIQRATTPPARNVTTVSRLRHLFVWATLASLLWLAAALLHRETLPVFGPATALLPGAAPQQFDYPFDLKKTSRMRFTLQQQLWLPRLHPTTFAFYPQDFLATVRVNGHDLRAPGLPLSASSHEGRSIDLAPYLHPGLNEIDLAMELRWKEASLQLAVSPWDYTSLLLLAFTTCATIATTAFLCTLLGASLYQPEIVILLVGITLRYIYFLGTPYFIRSFDYWGHADYLDYVTQHLSLPPPGANWEAFQPPLYYIIAAGLTKLLLALGLPQAQRYVLWQGLSLVFSIGVLITAWIIAQNLYENNARHRIYMLAVIAVAPPLVFNAARVSNDSLVSLLAFIWLALLLHHWRRPAKITWTCLAIITGLALLTKATALAYIVISAICLFLHPRLTLHSRARHLGALLVIVGLIAGGYYLPRALHATAVNTYLVGNLTSLNYHGKIDHVLLKSLIFNPVKIIRYPFVEIWGPRNDHFLEVFFKSMLLGEWIDGPFYKFLARVMMIIALLLIPPFLLGLYRTFRQKSQREWPLLLTLAGVFLAQWLFLQTAPYLSTQDFRFSVIMLIPLTYYFLKGTDEKSGCGKPIATFLLQLALLNSALYLAALSLGD